MFKGTSRFLQSMASSGRKLSVYPKSRKLRSGPSSAQSHFEVGTAYVRQISPLIHTFLKSGLTLSDIVDGLHQRGIDTPSGKPWTEAIARELVETIRLSNTKHAKRADRTS